MDPEGIIMDSVSFTSSWYGNSSKREGGWSLERIDPARICSGAQNWTASVSEAGGTPGRVNSVNASRPDLHGPEMIQAIWLPENKLRVVLDEPLGYPDPPVSAFRILDKEGIIRVEITASRDTLWLTPELPRDTTRTVILEAKSLTDCSGNLRSSQVEVSVPSGLVPNVLRINEILFNPFPGSFDFVELHNPSKNMFLVRKIQLTLMEADGQTIRSRLENHQERLILPGSHWVLSKNPSEVIIRYGGNTEDIPEPVNLFNIPDEGGIVVFSVDGLFQDSIRTDNSFHHVVLDNLEGISLERVSPDLDGMRQAAWMSSAEGATPGLINTQTQLLEENREFVDLSPEVVKPYEKYNNVLILRVQPPIPGLVATVRIFDLQGVLKARVCENKILSANEIIRWDVTGLDGRIIPPGYYILAGEFFGPDGYSKKTLKRVIVGY